MNQPDSESTESAGSNLPPDEPKLPEPSRQLVTLFENFLIHTGHEAQNLEGSLGLEFASGKFRVEVYPPSSDSTLFIVDVEVLQFAPGELEEDAATLLRLHHENDTARREDDWVSSFTPSNVLVLSRRMRVQDTTPEQLSEAIADGLERAEQLAATWNPDETSSQEPPVSRGTPPFLIRA